jgi:hypothetical protein
VLFCWCSSKSATLESKFTLIFNLTFCSGDFDMKIALVVITGMVFVGQWHFILNVIYEMTQILDIAVFRVWQSHRAGRGDQLP